MYFGYWSINQFDDVDDVFDSLIASPAAIISPVDLRSSVNDLDSKFQLIFSPKKDGVYIGCAYEISWLSSTTIRSLETALVDAGTRKPAGPIASGLAKENNIEANSQSLKWKVGVVLPGEYYIKVSNINGVDLENYSTVFTISEMPKGISVDEREKICKE